MTEPAAAGCGYPERDSPRMSKFILSRARPRTRDAEHAADASHATAAPAAAAAGGMPIFLQTLGVPLVQAKRGVNEPGDPFEYEADAVADSIDQDRRPPTPPPQRRRTPLRTATDPSLTALDVKPPDAGDALNQDVRARIEPALGVDLSGVRVHDSPAAHDTADALHARAFTHKNHIWLGSNEHADDTRLLAHEATHVVHQTDPGGEGVPAPIQRQLASSAPSSTSLATFSSPGSSDAFSPVMASLPGDQQGAGETGGDANATGQAADQNAVTLSARDTGREAPRPGEGGAADEAAAGAPTGAAGQAGGRQAKGEREGGGGAGAPAVVEGIGDTSTPPVPDTGAGALETGDLVLIDVELAEHQRWEGALGRVGAAGSVQRAEFIAEAVGSGFISGAASGAAMGLGIGLVSRVVPAIGPIIGGGMALHGLVTRDWAETGATIGRFGEGNDTYEMLANTIASVAAIIDIVSQVLTVINGIVGVVQAAAAVIAGGAVVAAFFTFGATLGIAAVAADVVGVCEEISVAITEVTTVLDELNAAILQPCVTLFRALHTFTTQADPREVEAQGQPISTAAAASGAALGAWLGGKAAEAGGHVRPAGPEEPPSPSQRPAHETPPPAAGDGPVVHFQDPAGAAPQAGATTGADVVPAAMQPAAAPQADITPTPVAAPEHVVPASAPEPARAAAAPEQLSFPGMDVPSSAPPAAPPPGPVAQGPHPITPDVEIRGDFSDASLRVLSGENTGAAAAGDIGQHQHQGTRGPGLISEHVVPGAQVRDSSFDPAHGAPDWQRTAPSGKADGRDYNRATTIVEHAPVSARKTALDNAETAALQARGGPQNPVEDLLLPSLQRHQQAVDEAIAAGEITPQQATDPTHRALAAQAEMWGSGEATGGAKARADAAAGGPAVDMPRRADRMREAEAARTQSRLAGEHIEEPDWDATFMNPNRSAPPGTQLPLPGFEGLAPSGGRSADQLTLPGFDRPSTAPNPNQLSLDFSPPTGSTTFSPPTSGGGAGGTPTTPQLPLPGFDGPIPPGPRRPLSPDEVAPVGTRSAFLRRLRAEAAGQPPPGPGRGPFNIARHEVPDRASIEGIWQSASPTPDLYQYSPRQPAGWESHHVEQQSAFIAPGGGEVIPGYNPNEDVTVMMRRAPEHQATFGAQGQQRAQPDFHQTVGTAAALDEAYNIALWGSRTPPPPGSNAPQLMPPEVAGQTVMEHSAYLFETSRLSAGFGQDPNAPLTPRAGETPLGDRAVVGDLVGPQGGVDPFENLDWDRTFNQPDPYRASQPPGTQLALPGMEHLAPRPGTPDQQLSLPGIYESGPNPNQLSFDFTARPPTTPSSPTGAPPPGAPPAAAPAGPSPSASTAPATSAASPPAPTWTTRAHQVGELFLPQVFGGGGQAPTYAEHQAAHRARFTADNQPVEGVERVNPEYPPPPATPAQITQIQNEIMNLLAVRAEAEQEAHNQSQRADVCEANQGPVQQSIDDTTAGISAVQAHNEAIARREAVNQEQQQRQQESQGLVAGYPSQATGLTALSVPLAAWEGFTDLASHLPGDAGDSMLRMNQEARQMQDAFGQMAAHMAGVDEQGPSDEAALDSDQQRLETTGEQAQQSDEQLHTASAGAQGLQDANEAALNEANTLEQAATDRSQECSDAVAEREQQAGSLAEQLRTWANAHAEARRQAVAATEARLQQEGRVVVSGSEQ